MVSDRLHLVREKYPELPRNLKIIPQTVHCIECDQDIWIIHLEHKAIDPK